MRLFVPVLLLMVLSAVAGYYAAGIYLRKREPKKPPEPQDKVPPWGTP